MKKFNKGSLIPAILFLVFQFSVVMAQRRQPPPPPQEVGLEQLPPPPQQQQPPRANLLRELNLSPAQVRQIRRINQETRPLMQDAQRRLREANFALDQAIYADAENEAEIQARVGAVHAAQIEVLKNRTRIELSIRRILTPEQLTKFRALRGEFAAAAAAARRNNPGGEGMNAPRRRRQQQRRQNTLRNLPKVLRPAPPRQVQ